MASELDVLQVHVCKKQNEIQTEAKNIQWSFFCRLDMAKNFSPRQLSVQNGSYLKWKLLFVQTHLFQFHYLHVIGRTPGLGLPCAETCCCLKEKNPLWKFTYCVMKLSPGTLITTPSLELSHSCLWRIHVSLVMGSSPWQSMGWATHSPKRGRQHLHCGL